MESNIADEFTSTLCSLQDAEHQFRIYSEHGIMNGYPIRIMKECNEKLKGILNYPMPDATVYPQLHEYMRKKQEIVDAKAEEERKLKEYMDSPEGMREQKEKRIEHLKTQSRICLRKIEQYTMERDQLQNMIDITQKRTEELMLSLKELEEN